MALDKISRPAPVYDGSDEPPESFADRVRLVFPKSATARLARAADVDVRLAQRWMSGRNDVPPPVEAFISEQIALLRGVSIAGMLRVMVEELVEKSIHSEVIASQIAAEYEILIGREIE